MLCVTVEKQVEGEKGKEGKVKEKNSFSPYTVTDSSPIVYLARQLYTHSKNVSLLCFHNTKGGLCFSLGKYRP